MSNNDKWLFQTDENKLKAFTIAHTDQCFQSGWEEGFERGKEHAWTYPLSVAVVFSTFIVCITYLIDKFMVF